jgi:hypothetical protein
MSFGLAIPVIFFRLPLRFLCRAHRTPAVAPSVRRTTVGTMRAPMSRDVSPALGQSWSGWSRAAVGW